MVGYYTLFGYVYMGAYLLQTNCTKTCSSYRVLPYWTELILLYLYYMKREICYKINERTLTFYYCNIIYIDLHYFIYIQFTNRSIRDIFLGI